MTNIKKCISKLSILLFISGLCFFNQGYSQNQKTNGMKTFKINIEDKQITDLNDRIKNTRWFTESESASWGPNLSVNQVKEFSNYWATKFEWKKQETYLNSFKQYKAEIDSLDIHFVYEKGSGTKHIPILFLHGWAENYTKYLKVVERFKIENPEMDLILPSLPGFAFSETPKADLNSEKVANILNKLMTEVLGYKQYYVHGGDFGSIIGEKMALDFPKSVKGLHLTDIPFYHLYGSNENLIQEESTFIEKVNGFSMQNGAYAMIQSTKPKTVSIGLNDSPVGLAYWLLQLYNDLSDGNKDLETKYNKDELLTNISIYWFTQSVYSSMRIYAEDNHGFGEPITQKTTVPTAFCFYPYDISGIPPKQYVNRFFSNVVSWSEQKSGGHFGTIENPSALHLDLVSFIKLNEK
jgi:pimeloyl-ACP methyl ester carboxylesterase